MSPESVADLVDLEQELSSIQRGITQMERITPNEPNVKPNNEIDDPFGDSFTNFPVSSQIKITVFITNNIYFIQYLLLTYQSLHRRTIFFHHPNHQNHVIQNL